MVYANLSFPIYHSALQTVAFTCGSDARSAGLGGVQTPNGDPDADTEVSPTSHEIMEAITDPETATGWYDSKVINHDHYLTQEEFSNNDFAKAGLGCLQGE